MQTILPTGSVIKDRYIVEDLLGKGGFGAVYLVRDKRVRQNLFALKEVIDPNKRERDRFTFEAELLKRVDHSSLPRVYRVFEDDQHDRAYILMDYIDGPNLEILRQGMPNKRLPLSQVLHIMRPIMNALDYLHTQHPPIIHRDVKPSNIIVPNSGDEAVLVDFGIAKEFDPEATTTAVRHASPGYGAPEQYGKGTNTRTDIYGMGATIYALLTGKVPADAFFRVTQMGARGTDPLEPINQIMPEVPQYIVKAVKKAMSIDSNERFASAGEFWHVLSAEPTHDSVVEVVTPLPDVTTLPTAETAARSVLPKSGPIPPSLTDNATAGVNGRPVITERRVGTRRKAPLLLLLLFVLLVGVAVALLLPGAFHHGGTTGSATSTPKTQSSPVATAIHHTTPSPQPSPDPTAASTPTAPLPSPSPGGGGSSIPTLASSYSGPIHNNAGLDSTMSLSSIRQNQQSFSGYFTVKNPLKGDGPFTGTVNTSGSIQFTVTSSQVKAPLFFTGTIRSDGSMSGSYCSLNSANQCDNSVGGSGFWSVSPINPGSGSSSVMPPNSRKTIGLDGTLFVNHVNQSPVPVASTTRAPSRRSKYSHFLTLLA